jgi:DNA-binding SARP family transcriptional activator
MVFFLSEHRVLLDGNRVSDWPNVRGKSIFNYLVTHRRRPVPREVLMNLFWPEVGSEAARNNLNVAIYGLQGTSEEQVVHAVCAL